MSMITRKSSSEAGRGRTRQVAIVAESTCCLPDELVERYGIGILPIPYVFGDETYLDGVDLTRAEFYRKLSETRTPPKTSPPSPGEYLNAWKEAARTSGAIVCVTVDSKISTLQRSARLAHELALEALPNTPVTIVDSLSAGMGQGFVALAAARAAAHGRSMEEVVKIAEAASQSVRMIVTLDTLEYLAKTSRIPQVAAFLGGALAIKPIIQISNGDIHPIARVRTRQRSIAELFEQMRRMAPDGARLHVAIQHAQAAEEAAEFEARVHETFDCVELYTTEFTPVMGGYCGPGLLGVAFYPEEETAGEDGVVTVPMSRGEDGPAVKTAPTGVPVPPQSPPAWAKSQAALVSGGKSTSSPRQLRFDGRVLDVAVWAGAYLYGSLPLIWLLASRRNVDLKRVGSGNVGATNLMAAGWPAWAAAGWVFDASKGLAPILVSRRLGRSRAVSELAGVCGVAGQCWPVFLRFSGGRGISAYVGAGAGMDRVAWSGALLPIIGGSLWRVAPRLFPSTNHAAHQRGGWRLKPRLRAFRHKAHAGGLGAERQTIPLQGEARAAARKTRSKSVPLGCFLSAAVFPLLVGVRRGFRPDTLVAPTLLSCVVMARRLTAALPDDATDGPAVHPKAWLYRLLYDRNTRN